MMFLGFNTSEPSFESKFIKNAQFEKYEICQILKETYTDGNKWNFTHVLA